MPVRLEPTVRFVHFVDTERDLPVARGDAVVVVLDAAFTPMPGGRPDVLAARPLFGDVVAHRDLFDEALERIDAWADRSRAADRLTVEGVTYWFRMRETMWRWMHERLLWRYVLASVGADGRALLYRVPVAEEALRDVAARLGTVETEVGAGRAADTATPRSAAAVPPPGLGRRIVRRLRRFARKSVAARVEPAAAAGGATTDPWTARLTERLERLARTDGPRVVVLTTPATYQPVASTGERRDPILGSVVDQLGPAGFEPILMAIGTDPRREDDRAILAADERMLPGSMLASRWGRPEDRARADRAAATIGDAVEGLRDIALEVDGVDLNGAFVDALRDRLLHIVRNDLLQQARVERFIAELEPSAILLAQEGIRVPWLVAGSAAGVPVFAVQHGILYRGHPGYPHKRHPAVPRASTTFVYGPYEREMLLERGAYLPDEVEVSGSPRLDLDQVATEGAPAENQSAQAADGAAVRAELGIRDDDRLLVVSTVRLPSVQGAHFSAMVDRLLSGPLPRVHVVFKLHPGERDDGPYRALLEGLARARGHAPPPISVVRDIDLYRLLRAADAHLGLHSTVLTDAVVTGTPNLIAMLDAHADLLGYVDARVAHPVRDMDDVLEALDPPSPPDPAARAAFLARHFRDGNAGARIARSIADRVKRAEPVAS